MVNFQNIEKLYTVRTKLIFKNKVIQHTDVQKYRYVFHVWSTNIKDEVQPLCIKTKTEVASLELYLCLVQTVDLLHAHMALLISGFFQWAVIAFKESLQCCLICSQPSLMVFWFEHRFSHLTAESSEVWALCFFPSTFNHLHKGKDTFTLKEEKES